LADALKFKDEIEVLVLVLYAYASIKIQLSSLHIGEASNLFMRERPNIHIFKINIKLTISYF